jgi:hypothetical protein
MCNIWGAQDRDNALKGLEVITLKNGSNEIDINADGLKDQIFVAWRENFNDHGFDMFTFYLRFNKKIMPDIIPNDEWYLVPFFNKEGVENSLTSFEEADCTSSDIRVLRPALPKKAPVIVIVGIRDYEFPAVDERASVRFLVYELKHNKENIAGFPPYYFQCVRTILGQKKYCDINDAFQEELGLGWYRADRKKDK